MARQDDGDTRVGDYLDDKLQTLADLDSLDALLQTVRNQHSLLRKQVRDDGAQSNRLVTPANVSISSFKTRRRTSRMPDKLQTTMSPPSKHATPSSRRSNAISTAGYGLLHSQRPVMMPSTSLKRAWSVWDGWTWPMDT